MKGKIEAAYAVYEGFKVKKYKKADKRADCLFWIKVIHTGRSHTTRFDNTWPIFIYEFFDLNHKKFNYEKAGWWIKYIQDPEIKTVYSHPEFSIVDPNAESRYLACNSKWIPGILTFLDKLQHYKDWNHFDLQVEHDWLVKKIEVCQNTGMFKEISVKFKQLQDSGEWDKVWVLRDSPAIGKEFYDSWIQKSPVTKYDPTRYFEYYDKG